MSFFKDRKGNSDKPAPVEKTENLETDVLLSAPAPDKSGCCERLDAVLSDVRGKGAVMKIYLESFKTLNDTFGYEFGEQLLAKVAAYFAAHEGCQVFRYAGVEFILLIEQASYAQAMDLADEITERFGQVWKIRNTDCLCSVHVGAITYPGLPTSAKELLKMLDYAVNDSVEAGLNTSVFYDSQFHVKIQRRQQIAGMLQEAVREDLFEFQYNPVYSCVQSRFARAETSIRLFVPQIGPVSAAEFLPLAEDSGQIVEFQYYAIEKTCAVIRELMDQGVEFESIALPISAILFFQMDMVDQVGALMEKYHLPPKKLAFKINESVLTTAYVNANIAMQELSDLGVELVLSNFGTGYSGISSILDLPVDVVKLERMFIWQLEISERSECLIEGLVGIARKLGLKVIAEGVETENQLQKLSQFGCEYEQGFYYSSRVSKERVAQMLGSSLEQSRNMMAAAER